MNDLSAYSGMLRQPLPDRPSLEDILYKPVMSTTFCIYHYGFHIALDHHIDKLDLNDALNAFKARMRYYLDNRFSHNPDFEKGTQYIIDNMKQQGILRIKRLNTAFISDMEIDDDVFTDAVKCYSEILFLKFKGGK
jgi:hypothetical protein